MKPLRFALLYACALPTLGGPLAFVTACTGCRRVDGTTHEREAFA